VLNKAFVKSYLTSLFILLADTYQEADKATRHFERCSDAESETENYQRRKRVRVEATSAITSPELDPSYNLPPSTLYGKKFPHFAYYFLEFFFCSK